MCVFFICFTVFKSVDTLPDLCVCVVGGGYVSGRIPIILFPGGWEEFSFSHFHFCLVCIFNQGQENS